MNRHVTEEDLLNRAGGPTGEAFNDIGCIVLMNLIRGKITYLEAFNGLRLLRDMALDRNGDIMSDSRVQAHELKMKRKIYEDV